MKKYLVTLSIVIVIVGGFFVFRHHAKNETAQATATPAVYITTATVKTAPMPHEISTLGSLRAWQQVDISPEIGEIIKAVYFKGGQHVQKGQPLFLLDDAIYQAAVNSAKADFKAAQSKYNRYIALRKSQTVAEQDYDNVLASYRTKLATFNSAKVNLAKMQLVAPFSGAISAPDYDAGQYVAKGTPLAKLVDASTLKLQYALPQKYIHQVKIGQTVNIKSNATPNKTFTGTLFYIAPSINPITRTVPLQARINNKNHRLSPGMFVQAQQILSIKKNALVIPDTAILPSISGPTVYVIRDNRAYLTSITTGVHINRSIEVTKGLKAYQVVAISGLLKLKDGVRVNAKIAATQPLKKARS
jgi:membrane fusion protein, multidrug efflux system